MSMFPEFLPWQRTIASDWLKQRDRFAHAWLIHGMPGIGKQDFALAAAASLLCEQPVNGLACTTCQACQWVAGGNHPDIRRIRPDALAQQEGAPDVVEATSSAGTAKQTASREIRIDQLRQLHTWFNTATHRGGWRVAVLYPAQAMNTVTANALLKVLEEPPAHTVFLLVADALDQLLPTLVSRCRRLPLPLPSLSESRDWLDQQGVLNASDWLAAASQAPVQARRMASTRDSACPQWVDHLLQVAMQAEANPDIGSIADQLEKEPAKEWIDILQRLFMDLILAHNGLAVRYYPALTQVPAIARCASGLHLAETAKWLAAQRALANHPLNAKLLTHSILQRAALSCRAVAI